MDGQQDFNPKRLKLSNIFKRNAKSEFDAIALIAALTDDNNCDYNWYYKSITDTITHTIAHIIYNIL